MFLIEDYLEFLFGWCFDIEESEDAGNVEENQSHSKKSSGADPVGKQDLARGVRTMKTRSQLPPSTRPKDSPFRVHDGRIQFPIF